MTMETETETGLKTSSFKIGGICSCEFKMVERRMKRLKGVESYSANPIMNQLKVTYNPSIVSLDDIVKAVSRAGAKATLIGSD